MKKEIQPVDWYVLFGVLGVAIGIVAGLNIAADLQEASMPLFRHAAWEFLSETEFRNRTAIGLGLLTALISLGITHGHRSGWDLDRALFLKK